MTRSHTITSSTTVAQRLRRFLRYRLTGEQADAEIVRRLRQRERSFLRLMQLSVYGKPRSPYRALLQHAGITFADLSQGVAREGLEATLGQLYEAGIYVTPEEFKGRRPVVRSGRTVALLSEIGAIPQRVLTDACG